MPPFRLHSPYEPRGDQPQAIAGLLEFVPLVGPLVMAILAAALALLHWGFWMALAILLFLGVLLDPVRHLAEHRVDTGWRRFQSLAGGLAVRVLGEVTPARCEILRNADAIVVEEMKSSGLYYKIWQSFAVLLPVRSVGVMGDERTYDYTIALRVVESQDGMTADWVKLPYELLEKISNRIVNEVKGVNRVVFDVTSKPPGTIEWE